MTQWPVFLLTASTSSWGLSDRNRGAGAGLGRSPCLKCPCALPVDCTLGFALQRLCKMCFPDCRVWGPLPRLFLRFPNTRTHFSHIPRIRPRRRCTLMASSWHGGGQRGQEHGQLGWHAVHAEAHAPLHASRGPGQLQGERRAQTPSCGQGWGLGLPTRPDCPLPRSSCPTACWSPWPGTCPGTSPPSRNSPGTSSCATCSSS